MYLVNPSCPCLDSLSTYGLVGDLIANINGKRYNFGPSYGLHGCAAHDEGTVPFCHNDAAPEWCTERWCYIDTAQCDGNITVHLTSYFAYVNNLHYSTEACGSGADGFSTWFSSAGEVGDACTVSSECFGDSMVCNPTTRQCQCRWGDSEDCDSVHFVKIVAAVAYVWVMLCYVVPGIHNLRVLLELGTHGSQLSASLAVSSAIATSVFLIFENVYKIIALVGAYERLPFYQGKEDYDVTTLVCEAFGSSSTIVAYCTLSVGWLNTLEATRRLHRLDQWQLRLSRIVVLAFTTVFLLGTMALAFVLVNITILAYQFFVAVCVVVGLMIAISFHHISRALPRIGREVVEDTVCVPSMTTMTSTRAAASHSTSRRTGASESSDRATGRTTTLSELPSGAIELGTHQRTPNATASPLPLSSLAVPAQALPPVDDDSFRGATASRLDGMGLTSRIARIARTATRISTALGVFLAGGLAWFIARNVFASELAEYLSSCISHLGNACGLFHVGWHLRMTFGESSARRSMHQATLSRMHFSGSARRSSDARATSFGRSNPNVTPKHDDALRLDEVAVAAVTVQDTSGGGLSSPKPSSSTVAALPAALSKVASELALRAGGSRGASMGGSPKRGSSEERRSLTANAVEGEEEPGDHTAADTTASAPECATERSTARE